MSRWLVHVLVVAAVVALGVAFAVSRRHVIDPAIHDRYARALRNMAALDATLNDEVLQADKGIVRHYDPVVHTLGELRRIPSSLRGAPKFLSVEGRAEVERDVALFVEGLRDKEELIEQFKSEAAVLRNSLHYFPIAADAFERAANDPREAMLAEQLLRHLLLYNQRPDRDLRDLVDADLAKLRGQAPRRADDGRQLLTTHATVILERRPQVDALLKRIGELPTA
ncbi:MAG TPA: DAHL domain-containing protein, partial [Polyangia bacterium]